MQLNVYIPRDKEDVVAALDETARRLGRQKNELVIEALETYLAAVRPPVGVFHLGPVHGAARADLYLEKWERTAIPASSVAETPARYTRRKPAR